MGVGLVVWEGVRLWGSRVPIWYDRYRCSFGVIQGGLPTWASLTVNHPEILRGG